MNKTKSILVAAGFALALAFTICSCAAGNPAPAQVIVCAGPDCPSQTGAAKGEEKAAIQRGMQDLRELEAACAEIRIETKEEIDCVIGTGESSLESAARDQSAFNARSQYAASLESKVKTESKSVTENANKEATLAFEQKANEVSEQTISRAFAYATRTVHDGAYYKVYTLMVVNPEHIKEIIEVAAAQSGNEEVMAQVKSPEVQSSFAKKIEVFTGVVLPILKRLIIR
ncbi:MAG: hypothetical protein LBU89_08400 [Fibromonadaceae bacterium]|jgi:hypothetical protein|nr:hypothetical protein [Fibromonadaceae bacterium]